MSKATTFKLNRVNPHVIWFERTESLGGLLCGCVGVFSLGENVNVTNSNQEAINWLY
jgi:hypothetical protein